MRSIVVCSNSHCWDTGRYSASGAGLFIAALTSDKPRTSVTTNSIYANAGAGCVNHVQRPATLESRNCADSDNDTSSPGSDCACHRNSVSTAATSKLSAAYRILVLLHGDPSGSNRWPAVEMPNARGPCRPNVSVLKGAWLSRAARSCLSSDSVKAAAQADTGRRHHQSSRE